MKRLAWLQLCSLIAGRVIPFYMGPAFLSCDGDMNE
jgi:hypothetical protein